MFVIASGLCIFVAGLEALSTTFVRGVTFDQRRPTLDAGKSNGSLNGAAKGGGGKAAKGGKGM